MAASTTTSNRINVHRVDGTLDEAGDALLYRYRAGQLSQDKATLRISIKGTFVGTIQVRAVDPGEASGNETNKYYVVASYTAPVSVVFEPGGSIDLYLYCSAYTSGSALCSIGK